MKKTILLLTVIFLSFAYASNAQSPKKYIVNKGEVAVEIIPEEEQYRFSEFQEGKVVFYNNEILPATMNYSPLYGEIHFLNDAGDTLSLGNPEKLKYIEIGEKVFYFAKGEGYIEVLQSYPSVMLGRRQVLKLIKSKVNLSEKNINIAEGAGSDLLGASPAGDIREEFKRGKLNYKSFYTRETPGELVISEVVSYFFIDQNNHIRPSRPSSVYKIFRRNKNDVKKYVDEYKINFKKEKDLKMLLEFCSRQGKAGKTPQN